MQKQNPVQETDLRREGYGKGPAFPPGPIGHFLGFSAINQEKEGPLHKISWRGNSEACLGAERHILLLPKNQSCIV